MFFTRDYDFGHSDTFNAVTGGQELQASSVGCGLPPPHAQHLPIPAAASRDSLLAFR